MPALNPPPPPGGVTAAVLPTLQLDLGARHLLALAVSVSSGSACAPGSSATPLWTKAGCLARGGGFGRRPAVTQWEGPPVTAGAEGWLRTEEQGSQLIQVLLEEKVEVVREGKKVMCEKGLREAREPAVLGESSDGGTAHAEAPQIGDGSKVKGGRKWVGAGPD